MLLMSISDTWRAEHSQGTKVVAKYIVEDLSGNLGVHFQNPWVWCVNAMPKCLDGK